MHIGEVALPEGVRPAITDRDFTIATVAAPSVIREEAAEAAEAAEGEVPEGELPEGEAPEGAEGTPGEGAEEKKAKE
jgi:large subunit ribosomal protein L25